MFYDFNHETLPSDMPLGSIMEEVPESVVIEPPGNYKGIVSSTGTNFFKFGDRLPTRETKSRRGRFNYLPSG
jgi:hypothetical protein